MEATRETLLERVRNLDAQEAWAEFFRVYWRPILCYAHKLGLAEADAQDVLQETMMVLMRRLPTFEYDRRKKFRNFLLTIVHRKAVAALRGKRRTEALPLDAPVEEGSEPLAERLAGADSPPFDEQDLERWEESLLAQALAELRHDPAFDRRTLDIFWAYGVEQKSPADVARQFAVKPNNVYQIKNRLSRELRTRVKALRDGE